MSGNAWEWENSCEGQTGASDKCRRRGGSVFNLVTSLDCATDDAPSRDTKTTGIGFRCCADTLP
jgi:formylglycine-generating enzyme required for sulfatase activity